MEGPLLTKSTEHNIDATINGDPSSNDEHDVNITINDDFSSTVAQNIPYIITIALNSFEFVMNLVQIVAAIVVVTGAKGDHPEATWIIVYTCGCIANVLILCWRFWLYQNASSDIGINEEMNLMIMFLKMILEYFFMGWSVVFLWVFGNSSSLDHTTSLYWLCVAFLAFSFIRYVLPDLICAAMCCCVSVTLCISGLFGSR